MTEAMNFFQSIFSFNNFAPATIGTAEIKLVKDLIKDAKTQAKEAATEVRNGETAQKLMREAEKTNDEQLKQNMATISVWHFEHSLGKYRQAAARYNEAGRIQTKKSKIFFAEARTMTTHAGEIEQLLNL